MPSQKPTDDERLSQLLQLKRAEKPDEEFWKGFDESLRSRQLAALVVTQSWYQRLFRLALLIARKSAPATAAASAIAIAFYVYNGSENSVPENPISSSTITADAAETTPLFVVDTIPSPNAINVSSDPSINGNAVYEVNAFTNNRQPGNYRIMAAPKQFSTGLTQPVANGGDGLGAKVIRSDHSF